MLLAVINNKLPVVLGAVRGRPKGRGRPSVDSYRLETILLEACRDELIRREQASGIYRTRVAAKLLIVALVGKGSR